MLPTTQWKTELPQWKTGITSIMKHKVLKVLYGPVEIDDCNLVPANASMLLLKGGG